TDRGLRVPRLLFAIYHNSPREKRNGSTVSTGVHHCRESLGGIEAEGCGLKVTGTAANPFAKHRQLAHIVRAGGITSDSGLTPDISLPGGSGRLVSSHPIEFEKHLLQ